MWRKKHHNGIHAHISQLFNRSRSKTLWSFCSNIFILICEAWWMCKRWSCTDDNNHHHRPPPSSSVWSSAVNQIFYFNTLQLSTKEVLFKKICNPMYIIGHGDNATPYTAKALTVSHCNWIPTHPPTPHWSMDHWFSTSVRVAQIYRELSQGHSSRGTLLIHNGPGEGLSCPVCTTYRSRTLYANCNFLNRSKEEIETEPLRHCTRRRRDASEFHSQIIIWKSSRYRSETRGYRPYCCPGAVTLTRSAMA